MADGYNPYDFEFSIMDDHVLLRVSVTNQGSPARTSGPPRSWDPGEGAEWEVVDAMTGDTEEPLPLSRPLVVMLADVHKDDVESAVHDWIEERRGEPDNEEGW